MSDRADLIADLSGPHWLERAASEYLKLRSYHWQPARDVHLSRAAKSMALTRARRGAGLVVLRNLVLPEAAIDNLEAGGFLSAGDADDPARIGAAIARCLLRATPFDEEGA